MGDLTTVDPVAVVLAWVKQHPAVLTAFGGAGHVSGVIEAPWPHLRVSDGPASDLADLRWRIASEVVLEVCGDPDGSTGESECRRLAFVTALAVQELVDQPAASGAVVVDVRPSGTYGPSPLATGQQRWNLGLLIGVHPVP